MTKHNPGYKVLLVKNLVPLGIDVRWDARIFLFLFSSSLEWPLVSGKDVCLSGCFPGFLLAILSTSSLVSLYGGFGSRLMVARAGVGRAQRCSPSVSGWFNVDTQSWRGVGTHMPPFPSPSSPTPAPLALAQLLLPGEEELSHTPLGSVSPQWTVAQICVPAWWLRVSPFRAQKHTPNVLQCLHGTGNVPR